MKKTLIKISGFPHLMLDGPNGNQMQFHNMMQHMQSMQIHTEQRPFHQFHPPPPRGDFNSYIKF